MGEGLNRLRSPQFTKIKHSTCIAECPWHLYHSQYFISCEK